jgi:hypothetical protein
VEVDIDRNDMAYATCGSASSGGDTVGSTTVTCSQVYKRHSDLFGQAPLDTRANHTLRGLPFSAGKVNRAQWTKNFVKHTSSFMPPGKPTTNGAAQELIQFCMGTDGSKAGARYYWTGSTMYAEAVIVDAETKIAVLGNRIDITSLSVSSANLEVRYESANSIYVSTFTIVAGGTTYLSEMVMAGRTASFQSLINLLSFVDSVSACNKLLVSPASTSTIKFDDVTNTVSPTTSHPDNINTSDCSGWVLSAAATTCSNQK